MTSFLELVASRRTKLGFLNPAFGLSLQAAAVSGAGVELRPVREILSSSSSYLPFLNVFVAVASASSGATLLVNSVINAQRGIVGPTQVSRWDQETIDIPFSYRLPVEQNPLPPAINPQPAPSPSVADLAPVVVTARRRDESVRTVSPPSGPVPNPPTNVQIQ